jgi:hypothetical protein
VEMRMKEILDNYLKKLKINHQNLQTIKKKSLSIFY